MCFDHALNTEISTVLATKFNLSINRYSVFCYMYTC